MLAAKRASLPKEPLPNAEGAVTVVVRMPDGSRQGRRFLKSDQLQVVCFQLPVPLWNHSYINLYLLLTSWDFAAGSFLFHRHISKTFKPGPLDW